MHDREPGPERLCRALQKGQRRERLKVGGVAVEIAIVGRLGHGLLSVRRPASARRGAMPREASRLSILFPTGLWEGAPAAYDRKAKKRKPRKVRTIAAPAPAATKSGEKLLGDNGYDTDAIRDDLEERGIEPVILNRTRRIRSRGLQAAQSYRTLRQARSSSFAASPRATTKPQRPSVVSVRLALSRQNSIGDFKHRISPSALAIHEQNSWVPPRPKSARSQYRI